MHTHDVIVVEQGQQPSLVSQSSSEMRVHAVLRVKPLHREDLAEAVPLVPHLGQVNLTKGPLSELAQHSICA